MNKVYTIILFTMLASVIKAQDNVWLPNVLFDIQNFTDAVHCNGGVGYIHPFLSGGGDSLAFTWYDNNGTPIASTINLDSIAAGQYYFEIRLDTMDEGTGYWFDAVIYDPGPLEITFHKSIAGSFNIAQVDGSNGSISVDVTGGIQGYTYLWSNGSTIANIYNLNAGNYTLTVTDITGCSSSSSTILTEPPSALHVVSIASPTINGTSYNISAKGAEDGKINLAVSGGAPPYTYNWFPYGENEKNPDTLRAREYTVVIKDANNISISQKITLTEPTELKLVLNPVEFTVNSKKYNLSCSDCSNGSITATVTGGVLPYTYSWSNGQTSATISNLTSGEYWVIVIDKNGAKQKDGIVLMVPERDDWSMSGNAGTNPGTNFIGTMDNKDLVFKVNNSERLRIGFNAPIELKGQIKVDSVGPDTINAVYVDEHGILKVGPPHDPLQLCKMPAYAFYRKLCPLDYNYYFIGSANTIPSSKMVIGNPTSLPGSYKLYVTGGILTEKLRVADPSSNYWADFVFDKKYKLLNLHDLSDFIFENKHLPNIPTAEEVKNEGIDIAEIQGKLLQKIEELTLYLIEQQKEIDQLKKSVKQNIYNK